MVFVAMTVAFTVGLSLSIAVLRCCVHPSPEAGAVRATRLLDVPPMLPPSHEAL